MTCSPVSLLGEPEEDRRSALKASVKIAQMMKEIFNLIKARDEEELQV